MADQRIKSTEEMVGSGHATKTDTLNRLTLVEHNDTGSHAAANESIRGLVVSRSDDANLAISAGWVVIDDGARIERRALAVSTTKAHGETGGALVTVYVYIDPDAASGGTRPTLNSNNIVVNTTAPTWDAAKGGLYSSNMRCVGAWFIDTDNHAYSTLVAHPDGETVLWMKEGAICNDQVNTNYANQDFSAFCPLVDKTVVFFRAHQQYVSAAGSLYSKGYDLVGTDGHIIGTVEVDSRQSTVRTWEFGYISTTHLYVDFKTNNAGAKYSIFCTGWRLLR